MGAVYLRPPSKTSVKCRESTLLLMMDMTLGMNDNTHQELHVFAADDLRSILFGAADFINPLEIYSVGEEFSVVRDDKRGCDVGVLIDVGQGRENGVDGGRVEAMLSLA